MALLNGVRVVLTNATSGLLTAGPAIVGFNSLTSASAVNGEIYQWVLEANFDSQGIANSREGGIGVYASGGGTLVRNTLWSTLPGNAQLTITGATHLIVSPSTLEFGLNDSEIDVKWYGAKGDGSTDDTAALQAAINAVFVTQPNFSSSGPLNNKGALFFPVGNYKISSPLTLTKVNGVRITGTNRNSVQITQAASGQSCFLVDGMAYSIIENIWFTSSGSGSCGIDLDCSSNVGVTTQSNTIRDCFFNGNDYGIRIGHSNFQCSENLILNCFFSGCTTAGVKVENFNALQQTIIGGNFQSCSTYGIWNHSGSIPVISGVGFQNGNSATDVFIDNNGGSDTMVISGCRTESANFVHVAFQACVITGCGQTPSTSGFFAKADNSAVFTINSCISINGQVQTHFNPAATVDNCQFGRDDWLDGGQALYRNLQTGKTYLGIGTGTSAFHSSGFYDGSSGLYYQKLNYATPAGNFTPIFDLQQDGLSVFRILGTSSAAGADVVVLTNGIQHVAQINIGSPTAGNTDWDLAGATSGLTFNSGMWLAWSNNTSSIVGVDTGVSRSAAGVVALGNGSNGDASATIKAKTKAGAPSTSDVPAGTWALIRDTTNSTTKLYYNNAGSLQVVALT